jgi:hypothetical protein
MRAIAARTWAIAAAVVVVVAAVLGYLVVVRSSVAGPATPGEPTAPASPTRLGCIDVPSSCGYPDASNTGVTPGTQLQRSGSVTADQPGQVIEGLDITGELNITASGVTVRDVRVTGGKEVGNSNWVVVLRPGVTDVLLENVELTTPKGSEQDLACVLNLGDAVPVIRRANIHGCSAGVSTGAGVIEDSYIHDMAQVPGLSHVVGIASNGGGGLTVRHNTILNQFDQTGVVAFYQDFGVQANNLVTDNLVAGGGYCFYGGKGEHGPTRDIRFIGNRLSSRFSPNCGHFGVIASFALSDPGNRFEGNYWDETGREVEP